MIKDEIKILKLICIIEQILFAVILLFVLWDVISFRYLYLGIFILVSNLTILIKIRNKISITMSISGLFIWLICLVSIIRIENYKFFNFLVLLLIILSFTLTLLLLRILKKFRSKGEM